jgi:hypothetical protein
MYDDGLLLIAFINVVSPAHCTLLSSAVGQSANVQALQ